MIQLRLVRRIFPVVVLVISNKRLIVTVVVKHIAITITTLHRHCGYDVMINLCLFVLTRIKDENNNYGNPSAQADDDGARVTFNVDIL